MSRLLIVDDALIMRAMIREVAVKAGWEVVGEAPNGQIGLEQYRELKPDLVTLDMVMPVLGGLETLRQLRQNDPNARVIIITALDQKQTLSQAIAAGALDFVVKPFDHSRLLNLLTKLKNSTANADPQERGSDYD